MFYDITCSSPTGSNIIRRENMFDCDESTHSTVNNHQRAHVKQRRFVDKEKKNRLSEGKTMKRMCACVPVCM